MRSVSAFLIFLCCVGFIGCNKPSSPCPRGQFLLKSQCVLCHPTCSECDGHELFECTTCGVDEDGQERFLHQGRCRTHCPRGLYPDRGHYACLPCIANCELCADGNICAKCREHYKLQNGVCQTASCNTGQVQDPDTGECIDCEMGCKTCSTEDPGICSSCVEGYFLFRHHCRRHCPQSTYEDWGRGVCLSCPAPCSDCRSNTRCLACQPGYFLNGGDCIKQCPPQTFSDSTGWLCQACHGSCQTCHGPRSSDCNLCLGGNPPLHGQCPLINCPLGQFYDGQFSECHTCDASCKTCFGPQALDCSTCFKGNFLSQDSSCVVQCPSGSYASSATQLCEDCSPNCESCMDTRDNCISCSKGSYTLFLHQGRCWSTCPEGFFETLEGACEACDVSCSSCDGIKTQCLSCADGHYLEGGMCRLNCSLRSYPADDGTCRRCPPHCDVCSDDRTCFKCSFLYLMLNGVCKASCPMGYYEDMEEGHCGQCHLTCDSCSGPLADDCETCSTFSPKLYKGACSKDCPPGTYYDTEAMECQECHQTCFSCFGSDANQCTQCEKALVLDPNTMLCGVTGDTDCPPRTYLHDDQFTCMGCHRHCYSCEGPSNDECQTCAVPKYLQNSSCVSECPDGTYATEQDADGKELGLCLFCDNACSSCTGALPKDCLTCSVGHLRLLHLCVTNCPTGYYREGSQCERCDRSCELCGAGPESCRACAPPLLELQGTKLCVEHCPHRFYQLNDMCKQCHTSCQTCTDASPQGCLTCDWGSTLKDKVCYPRCEEGRYFSEKETCEPCDSSCRHCTGLRPDQCLTCHRGFALHAVERRCTRCCQAGVNDTDCCVCDGRSGLCVEAPQPKSGDDQVTDLNVSSAALKHTSAGIPIALLLALGLALAVFALIKAHARKKLCWGQSYERLNGSANMPHGVPEPDSGDEVDVVYTSRGGSVYRRYSFIHEQDADAPHHVDESTCLNQM
ncbi:proprotein convertase subtilisin/kexin type 5-like isoform X1 [Pseudochaenichthys georgianus]|uniref:proprotein convertase subtilisin/kexin type 5-like isoform X1 n=1 Tax=Pseudochaenichthys georgianus TaxID=52239 RepID=UPI00146C07D4|nr:proprotein convertase subtilisin/kexin type 5-like isoform X1 [Pseudochaenichthys georgianus]